MLHLPTVEVFYVVFNVTAEFAEKWGITQRRVTGCCKETSLAGAERKGRTWFIPENIKKR